MRVRVTLYFPFRDELPEDTIELDVPEGTKVSQVVEALVARFPFLRPRFYDAQGNIHRHISALVNGVSIQYQNGWATSVPQGAEIVLLPPVGGG